MATYLVTWEYDAEDVDSPREAAQQAWDALTGDPESIACVFDVRKGGRDAEPVRVDLLDDVE